MNLSHNREHFATQDAAWSSVLPRLFTVRSAAETWGIHVHAARYRVELLHASGIIRRCGRVVVRGEIREQRWRKA